MGMSALCERCGHVCRKIKLSVNTEQIPPLDLTLGTDKELRLSWRYSAASGAGLDCLQELCTFLVMKDPKVLTCSSHHSSSAFLKLYWVVVLFVTE